MTTKKESFWLDADKYHIREVPLWYEDHPAGLPSLKRNTVIIGPLGAGKTMLVKRLCYELGQDKSKLTLYLDVHRYLSKIEVESTYPYEDRVTPRDIQLAKCAGMLLSIALITKSSRYGSAAILQDLHQHLPPSILTPRGLGDAATSLVTSVEEVLDYGADIPPALKKLPSPSSILQILVEVCHKHGKSLVVILDQVDKTSPLVFKELAGFLQRGEHISVLAARPYPCAPEPTHFPSGMIGGDEFEVVPIARDVLTPTWQEFMSKVITNAPLHNAVKHHARKAIDLLSAIVELSVRNCLRICFDMQRRMNRGTAAPDAWHHALAHFVRQQEAMALDIIGSEAKHPEYALAQLKDYCIRERHRRDQPAHGPVSITLTEEIQPTGSPLHVLRRSIREGLASPTDNTTAIDPPLQHFRLGLSLLISPDAVQQVSGPIPSEVRVQLPTSLLRKWLQGPGRRGGKAVKTIFVPYWMTEPTGRVLLAERLETALPQTAKVLTGKDIPKNKPWADEIKRTIKDHADLVIADLLAPRRDILVEFGWAVGSNKPVLFVRPSVGNLAEELPWLNEWPINAYDQDKDFHDLIGEVLRILQGPPDRVSTWKDDPSGHSIPKISDPRQVSIIGNEAHLSPSLDAIKQTCREVALEFTELLVPPDRTEKEATGGLLYDTISLARQACTLIIGLDGTSVDPLSCVAGGVFSTTSFRTLHRKKKEKRLIILATEEIRKDQRVPPLLSNLRATTQVSTHRQLVAALQRRAKEVQSWIHEASI